MSQTHIVAIDGSPYSDAAFKWAMTQTNKNDRILLFNGVQKNEVCNLKRTTMEVLSYC